MNSQGNPGQPSNLFGATPNTSNHPNHQDLPTADSLFGDGAPFLSQLSPKPLPQSQQVKSPARPLPGPVVAPPSPQQRPPPPSPHARPQQHPRPLNHNPPFHGRPPFQPRPQSTIRPQQRPPYRPPQHGPPQPQSQAPHHRPPFRPGQVPNLRPHTPPRPFVEPRPKGTLPTETTSTHAPTSPVNRAQLSSSPQIPFAVSPVLSPSRQPIRPVSGQPIRPVSGQPIRPISGQPPAETLSQHQRSLQSVAQAEDRPSSIPKMSPSHGVTNSHSDADLPSADILFGEPSGVDFFQTPISQIMAPPVVPDVLLDSTKVLKEPENVRVTPAPEADNARSPDPNMTSTQQPINGAPALRLESEPGYESPSQTMEEAIEKGHTTRDLVSDPVAPLVDSKVPEPAAPPQHSEVPTSRVTEKNTKEPDTKEPEFFPDSADLFGGPSTTDASQLFGGWAASDSIAPDAKDDAPKQESPLELDASQDQDTVVESLSHISALGTAEAGAPKAFDPPPSMRESQRPPNSFKSLPSQSFHEHHIASPFSARAQQVIESRNEKVIQSESVDRDSATVLQETPTPVEPFSQAAVVEASESTGEHGFIENQESHSVSDLFGSSGLSWQDSFANLGQQAAPTHLQQTHDVFSQQHDSIPEQASLVPSSLEEILNQHPEEMDAHTHQEPVHQQPLFAPHDSLQKPEDPLNLTMHQATESLNNEGLMSGYPAAEYPFHGPTATFTDPAPQEHGMLINSDVHTAFGIDVTAPQQHLIPFDHGAGTPGLNELGLSDISLAATTSKRTLDRSSSELTDSYSIMELNSPIESSHFFVQCRQSPLIRDQFASLGDAARDVQPKEKSIDPEENDSSGFDQVSLAEDVSNATTAQTQAEQQPIQTQPQKERGLASLFDPSTLGAVEDLLNMPKSAAFERGMNRLFKGVKSSASSMFAAPLGQSLSNQSSAASPSQDHKNATFSSASDSDSKKAINMEAVANHPGPSPLRANEEASRDTVFDAAPPQRDADDTVVVQAAVSENSPHVVAETPLPPPPPPPPMFRMENAKSNGPPKLEKKPFKVPRVPAVQHNWVPTHSMFIDAESENFHEAALEEKNNGQPEQKHSVHNGLGMCRLINAGEPEHVGREKPQEPLIEKGLSKLFDGIRETLRGKDLSYHGAFGSGPSTTSPAVNYVVDKHPVQEDDSTVQNLDTHEPPKAQIEELPEALPMPPSTETPSDKPDRPVVPHVSAETWLAEPLSATVVETTQPDVRPMPERSSIDIHSQPLHHDVQPRGSTPELFRREQSPILQRSASPSILDKSVLLRKESVVSAILAEHQSSHSPIISANADTKGKLLEKARLLLEKRQRMSGHPPQHDASAQSSKATSPQQPSVSTYSGSTSFVGRVDDSRGGSVHSEQTHESERSMTVRTSVDGGSIPGSTHSIPVAPTKTPVMESHENVIAENDALKQRVHMLTEELENARNEAEASTTSSRQAFQNEIKRLETALQAKEEQYSQDRAVELQHHVSLEYTIHQLRQELEDARSMLHEKHQTVVHEDATQIDLLKHENHVLQQQLKDVQDQLQAYTQSTLNDDRVAELEAVNSDLQAELRIAQERIQELAQKNTAPPLPVNITVDGMTYTPEQLSKETQGLRRQLKGQRMDIKEMQDLAKRTEDERQELLVKIEQLERSLDDAERLRYEEKSHARMKDEAFRDIQARLAESFELEKRQYVEEEALKLATVEYKYEQLQDTVRRLKKELADQQNRSTLSSEHQTSLDTLREQNDMLQKELNSSQVKVTASDSKVSELELLLSTAKESESQVRESFAALEDRYNVLQSEMVQLESSKSHSKGTMNEASHEMHGVEGLDSEASQAAKWREDCIAAQEDKMRVEDQLRRVESQLAAARMEIEQLVSSQGQEELVPDNDSSQAAKWREDCIAAQEEKLRVEDQLRRVESQLAAARMEIEQLVSSQTDVVSDQVNIQISELTSVLEQTRAQLEQEQADHASKLQSAVHENCSELQKSLDSVQSEFEQTQSILSRTQQMLKEKQQEVEVLTVDLDSAVCRSVASENSLKELKLQLASTAQQNSKAEEQVQMLQQKLEDMARAEQDMVAQMSQKENTSEDEIKTLSQRKAGLESQISMRDEELARYAARAQDDQNRVSQLEGKLEQALQEKETMAVQAKALEAQVSELKSLSETRQETMDAFLTNVETWATTCSSMLRATELEDLEQLRQQIDVLLGQEDRLGKSIDSIRILGATLFELCQTNLRNRPSGKEVQKETSEYSDGQNLMTSETVPDDDEAPGTPKMYLGNASENEVDLQDKLTKMEQAFLKLQQFLQEFHDEKTKAILELQEKLDASETDIAQLRSHLAKAQAMLQLRPGHHDLNVASSEPSLGSSSPQAQLVDTMTVENYALNSEGLSTMDDTLKGTEKIRHDAVLALDPLREEKAELEKTLLDLRHRYERSQKENDQLLSQLEHENQKLRKRVEMLSPDMSSEHLERIHDMEQELVSLRQQLKTAQREREFTRQDLRLLKAELLKARSQ
ncbi:hypothetical protein BGZ94_005408 [Podila epigama]|nr:hypothetical protein BGZ94_005408 [Podila epigama]